MIYKLPWTSLGPSELNCLTHRLPNGVRTNDSFFRSAAIYHNYDIIMTLLWEFMALL